MPCLAGRNVGQTGPGNAHSSACLKKQVAQLAFPVAAIRLDSR